MLADSSPTTALPTRADPDPARGTVYWFTGLSGAGKTTLASMFVERLRARLSNVVYLDGDVLRDVFGNDLGYTEIDRRRSAERNSRLCRALAEQGIHVVCATISLFHDCQAWNREHIAGYVEILIKAPMTVLRERDCRGLYHQGDKGRMENVVGVDITAQEPLAPELTVLNDGARNPQQVLDAIWSQLGLEKHHR